jgi:hypothetical protein
MLPLFRAFLQIIMRRLGPEDLPDSRLLAIICLNAYVLSQVPPALQVYGASWITASAIAIDVLMLVGAVWALLRLTGHSQRYRQTLTALLGTNALLTLPLVPLNFWLERFTQAGHAPAGPSIAILLLITWSLTVQAHILARALSRPFVIGLLIAVGYFIANYALIWQLAPPRL